VSSKSSAYNTQSIFDECFDFKFTQDNLFLIVKVYGICKELPEDDEEETLIDTIKIHVNDFLAKLFEQNQFNWTIEGKSVSFKYTMQWVHNQDLLKLAVLKKD